MSCLPCPSARFALKIASKFILLLLLNLCPGLRRRDSSNLGNHLAQLSRDVRQKKMAKWKIFHVLV